MNNIILNRKPTFRNKDGQEIIDITKKSMQFTDEEPNIVGGQYVSEDTQMRPDLISYQNFGDDSYWDIILKFNGVSNPFAIDTTQFLFIPDVKYMLRQLYVESTNNDKIVQKTKSQYIDPTKKQIVDPKQSEYSQAFKEQLAKMKSHRISKTNMPPNFSETSRQATILQGEVLNNLSLGE